MERPKINMLVARNIDILMRAKDLDPAKLARRAGINPTGIYDILKGKSKSPKIETLGKIALGLGVPLPALLSEVSDDHLKQDLMFVFENLPDHEKKRLIQTGQAWLSDDLPVQ